MTYKKKVQIENCTLYLGDCLEVMGELSGIDSVICDPPYGINENNKKNISRVHKAKPKDYGLNEWDKKPADVSFILDLKVPTIIFGGNYFDLPPTRCYLIWDKLNGDSDFADCEIAWTNLNKAIRIKRHLWNGMIRKDNEERFHLTQKPVELMKWCISHLPKDCTGTILDPFMGSGTTGVACAKMGRSFIGIELDEDYFNIAVKRIEDAYRQKDLFI